MSGIEDALRRCGATEATLDPAEKDALDRRGDLALPAVMDPAWLEAARAAFESAAARDRQAPAVPQTGSGARSGSSS